MILVYNLLLVALDLGLVVAWRRQRTGRLWLSGLALAGAAMLALGDLAMALVPDDPYYGPRFMLYGCLAWGIFLHGTFLLAASAFLFRRVHPRASTVAAVLALCLAGVAVDAVWIEPRSLEVTRITLESEKLEDPLRLAVVAPGQAGQIGAVGPAIMGAAHRGLVCLAGERHERRPGCQWAGVQ